jgi:hypothetical protein
MKASKKWLREAFTTLVDSEPATNGKWIDVQDWKLLLTHYFDFGDRIQIDIELLTKAIKSIDLDSVILNVTKGNNSGVHFVRRRYNDIRRSDCIRPNASFFWAERKNRTLEPPLPFPNERKKWLALLENSARHVAKITNSSLRTGIIPSFETRSIECISSHPIDKTIADHHRQNAPPPITNITLSTRTEDNITSEAIPPRALTMPPGYFESHSARALFQPKPEETVLQCLQRRIDLLSTVIVDWPNGMPGILDGAHEAFDEMGDSSKCRVFNTALYLRNSYTAAVQVMGNGKSWEYAVEQAIDSLSAIGVETYHRSETIKEFHRQFRKYELFEIKSSTKSVTYVKSFAIFPEANNMLL